jgi:hypothetical protein
MSHLKTTHPSHSSFTSKKHPIQCPQKKIDIFAI